MLLFCFKPCCAFWYARGSIFALFAFCVVFLLVFFSHSFFRLPRSPSLDPICTSPPSRSTPRPWVAESTTLCPLPGHAVFSSSCRPCPCPHHLRRLQIPWRFSRRTVLPTCFRSPTTLAMCPLAKSLPASLTWLLLAQVSTPPNWIHLPISRWVWILSRTAQR